MLVVDSTDSDFFFLKERDLTSFPRGIFQQFINKKTANRLNPFSFITIPNSDRFQTRSQFQTILKQGRLKNNKERARSFSTTDSDLTET